MDILMIVLNGLRTFIGFVLLAGASMIVDYYCISTNHNPIFGSWYFFLLFVAFVGGKLADKIFADGIPAGLLGAPKNSAPTEPKV